MIKVFYSKEIPDALVYVTKDGYYSWSDYSETYNGNVPNWEEDETPYVKDLEEYVELFEMEYETDK